MCKTNNSEDEQEGVVQGPARRGFSRGSHSAGLFFMSYLRLLWNLCARGKRTCEINTVMMRSMWYDYKRGRPYRHVDSARTARKPWSKATGQKQQRSFENSMKSVGGRSSHDVNVVPSNILQTCENKKGNSWRIGGG